METVNDQEIAPETAIETDLRVIAMLTEIATEEIAVGTSLIFLSLTATYLDGNLPILMMLILGVATVGVTAVESVIVAESVDGSVNETVIATGTEIDVDAVNQRIAPTLTQEIYLLVTFLRHFSLVEIFLPFTYKYFL